MYYYWFGGASVYRLALSDPFLGLISLLVITRQDIHVDSCKAGLFNCLFSNYCFLCFYLSAYLSAHVH